MIVVKYTNMKIRAYGDLVVWRKGMDLAEKCYHVTRGFPPSKAYGLSSQIRRAGASVPANVAEGHGREHLREYLHYLSIASGSLTELETHIILASRLTYLSGAEVSALLEQTSEVGRMLTRLKQSLRRVKPAPRT